MVDVRQFVRQASGLATKNHPERIKALGWFLHCLEGKSRFTAGDLRRCYDLSDFNQPANMNRFLDSLTEKSPPELLKDVDGYRLANDARSKLDGIYGSGDVVLTVETAIASLPGRISDEGERLFLAEAIKCYRHEAFRATIVMAWNLAYDHLLRWLLADPERLSEFAAGVGKRNPRKADVVVASRDDFHELKEDEVLDIVGGLSGFPAGVKRVLKEKLGRRNTFAHPSLLKIERAQVDDMLTDLVNNVILNLRL